MYPFSSQHLGKKRGSCVASSHKWISFVDEYYSKACSAVLSLLWNKKDLLEFAWAIQASRHNLLLSVSFSDNCGASCKEFHFQCSAKEILLDDDSFTSHVKFIIRLGSEVVLSLVCAWELLKVWNKVPYVEFFAIMLLHCHWFMTVWLSELIAVWFL